MIITRTPYRMSLFGGGTDFPFWFQERSGSVISMTINKYSYLMGKILPPFFQHKYRLAYSKIELANYLDEIEHPAFREAIRKFSPEGQGLEIHHHGDLPARSGLGTSSAFSVGLIQTLLHLNEIDYTKAELANLAIDFEHNTLREKVGYQDQIACSIGGFNKIMFNRNMSWEISQLVVHSNLIKQIEDHMVLVYSGVTRISSKITEPLLNAMETKVKYFERTLGLVSEFEAILLSSNPDLKLVGELLAESWHLKAQMNPTSVTKELAGLYEFALSNGALGGKILGAGGGGFMLFWCLPQTKAALCSKLKNLIVVPFKIEFNGSTILQYKAIN